MYKKPEEVDGAYFYMALEEDISRMTGGKGTRDGKGLRFSKERITDALRNQGIMPEEAPRAIEILVSQNYLRKYEEQDRTLYELTRSGVATTNVVLAHIRI